jgi:hypothetical protein
LKGMVVAYYHKHSEADGLTSCRMAVPRALRAVRHTLSLGLLNPVETVMDRVR